MLAHTLQIEFIIPATPVLGNDMVDVHIPLAELSAAANAGVPAVVAGVLTEIVISVTHTLYPFLCQTYIEIEGFLPYFLKALYHYFDMISIVL